MAHGAGGKATHGLSRACCAGLRAWSSSHDAGRAIGDVARDHHRRFVVKPLRFPGGSIGELAVNGTVNDLAMAGARPVALTLVADPRGRAGRRHAARRGRGDRRAAARGRRPDRRRRHEGRRARPRRRPLHHDDRPRPPDPRAAFARPPARRPHPALGPDRRARHGDHARARRVRARRRRSSPTRSSCGPRWTGSWARASRVMRDATRGGVASVLGERARAAKVAMLVRREGVPVAPAPRRRRRATRHRPDVRRQRGRLRRDRRARRRRTP